MESFGKRKASGRAQGHVPCDVPGIVIAFGGLGESSGSRVPALQAFVYGKKVPSSPTLPFGRWKRAS